MRLEFTNALMVDRFTGADKGLRSGDIAVPVSSDLSRFPPSCRDPHHQPLILRWCCCCFAGRDKAPSSRCLRSRKSAMHCIWKSADCTQE